MRKAQLAVIGPILESASRDIIDGSGYHVNIYWIAEIRAFDSQVDELAFKRVARALSGEPEGETNDLSILLETEA